jgi:N-acetylneuraminate synthase/N,N'-diacetyllegionaminate synthase
MPESFHIAGRKVGTGAPCFVIAEVGINHGGDEALCARMIDEAANSGADAVKLQTVTPEESYHPQTPSYAVFKGATLSREANERLQHKARDAGIILFSTPGDPTALRLLLALDVPAVKISSGLLTNIPLIEMAAASGKPLIMSTGMARAEEVEEAVRAARGAGCRALALLQCTSLYPAPAKTINLRAMAALQEIGQCPVGYSDHHAGHLAVLAAVASGACIIEKHFTLDASVPGADHEISVEPAEFAIMVRAIRDIEAMMGSAEKMPVAAELPLRDGRHRRLVAARDLLSGVPLKSEDIYLMRLPADQEALPARRLRDVLGKRTTRAVERLTGLTSEMVVGLE